MVDKVRAYELRQRGLTFKQMAVELGCSESHLRAIMKGVAKGVRHEEKSVHEELQRISKELSNVVKRLEQ